MMLKKVEVIMSKVGTDPLIGNEQLCEWFSRFSEQTAGSDMYQFLSKMISLDSDLLKIASTANQSQPVPNLFLAAVNFLLYKNPDQELAKFYPNHSGNVFCESSAFEVFKVFCIAHSQQLTEIMNSKLVQTNEVRRCALLLPAIIEVAKQADRSLTLIDIGTSTGLNLLFDLYNYEYTNGFQIGDVNSKLKLSCESRGNNFSNIVIPKISQRIGIDLNPINLKNNDEVLWTLSLVWADQIERIERLKYAIRILNQNEVTLLKGEGNKILTVIAEKIPLENAICIMHSFTLNQFSTEAKLAFEECLKLISQKNDVWEIGLEWIGTDTPELYLIHFSSGNLISKITLATCHQHGEWISWI